MNQVEIYKREAIKIFQQITETMKAAEADKTLQDFERHGVILALQSSRTMLVDSIFEMVQLCEKQEKGCDTQQSLTSQK